MTDTVEQAPKPAATPSLNDKPDWNSIWKKAEAKAEIYESYQRGEIPKQPKPKKKTPAKPKEPVEAKVAEPVEEVESDEDEAPKAVAPTPKAKAAPTEKNTAPEKPAAKTSSGVAQPKAERVAVNDEDESSTLSAGADEEEYEAPKARSRADKERDLQSLAKELGLRVEGATVSTEERVGFRAEKRKWHEKQEARERDFEHKLNAAERYFEPLSAARKMVEQGDYDGALRHLGLEGGLSEATRLHLERESGKDPKVRDLEKQVEQMRREQQDRMRQEQEYHAKMEQERAKRESIRSISSRLNGHPTFGRLADNEWLLQGVFQVMQDNYDGIDTLSAEDAMAEKIHLLRSDPRAKQVYEALHFGVFGSRDPKPEPESDDSDLEVDRSDPPSARPAVKRLPKTLSKREAAEALAPSNKPLTAEEWMKRHTARMKQASDD